MALTIGHNYKAPQYTKGRGGHSIEYIVIHHWDDPDRHPSFNGVRAYMCSGKSNNSAHYIVEDGRCEQLVSDHDTAWHAGNWNMNQRSIGIECNPRCSEGDKRSVAELVNHLLSKYGNLKIIAHKDVVTTACPGRYYPPKQVLGPYLASGGSAKATYPPTTGYSAAYIDFLADAVIRGEYGNGPARKAALGDKYAAVQARVNEKLSGNSGSNGSSTPAPAPDIDALADAVIRGEYGNGEARRTALGSNYAAVQARVNEKLSGNSGSSGSSTSAPTPDIDALADAVIRGDYGNGQERRNRLGGLYDAVQARVNEKLS